MIETYAFSAAHFLPTFPEGHKCRRMHGHTWEVTVEVLVDAEAQGFAFDHAELDAVMMRIIAPLDHQVLNTIPGLERGLGEDCVRWLVERAMPRIDALGARLVRLDVTEWSSRSARLVRHTKGWRLDSSSLGERCPVGVLTGAPTTPRPS